ncbi:MAG: rhomboid family intramembrane serine protease [Acidobacteriota bacterium]
MIPLRHTHNPITVPWVTRVLVLLNVLVFAWQFASPRMDVILVGKFSFVPARMFHPQLYGTSLLVASSTLLTSLFLHGGFVHLIGNMLYLWIFGRSVEDRLGHGRYLAFYLASGAIGNLAQAFAFQNSEMPTIGASGCIAGVLGAFLILFPRARVVTLLPLIVYWGLAEIPALLFLPIWFALQFLNGWMAVASPGTGHEMATVAWWAHIGGFAFGLLFAFWWKGRMIIPTTSEER